ncbi:hypothetical protein ACTJJB_04500 [Chitinophaga sp. 22536]|uniref:hypothetical protein n=1 Tax=unclassified Chitinophaga TaxID=2619133 RepID=UPI003F86C9B1
MNKRARRNRILRKIIKIAPYAAFLALGVLGTIYVTNLNRLKRNYTVTTAIVLSFAADYKGSGGSIDYEFVVEGRKYKGTSGYPDLIIQKGYSLVGRTFPVAYEKGKTANSMILILPERFESFNIPFPDSLEWVRAYSKY